MWVTKTDPDKNISSPTLLNLPFSTNTYLPKDAAQCSHAAEET